MQTSVLRQIVDLQNNAGYQQVISNIEQLLHAVETEMEKMQDGSDRMLARVAEFSAYRKSLRHLKEAPANAAEKLDRFYASNPELVGAVTEGLRSYDVD